MNRPAQRRARAANLIDQAGLGAAAFVPGPSFKYLTDVSLHLMERPTIFSLSADGSMHAVIPSLEHQKWSAAMSEVETYYWTDAEGPDDAISKFGAAIGPSNSLGVEGLRMRAREYVALTGHWNAGKIVDADAALVDLRMFKDDTEISELRRAIEISELALAEALEAGIGGRSEIEIAAQLRAAMLSHGATGFAFDPIVLTGGASADPHGDVGQRIVQPGAPLLIDFGASYGDMHADITRTVFCEYASDEHRTIYDTVLKANEAGLAAVGAGIPIGDVDDAATKMLEGSTFADLILHKTGHGLGRDVHEAPVVMRSNRELQQAGMVFTVEPGLYRMDDIGVRIEDDVLVTEDGVDCLTSFSKEFATYA